MDQTRTHVGGVYLVAAVLLCGVAAWAPGSAVGGAVDFRLTEPGGTIGFPVQPTWADMSQCAGDCNFYSTTQKNYNVCYACGCLFSAATNDGERTSADAQCNAALAWPEADS
jgi:hypothetical protein